MLVSVRDEDKEPALEPLQILADEGFRLVATSGTARFLEAHGFSVDSVNKAMEGSPNSVEMLLGGEVDLVINTAPIGDAEAVRTSASMRRAALERGLPYFTTLAGARAAAAAIRDLRSGVITPVALQDLY